MNGVVMGNDLVDEAKQVINQELADRAEKRAVTAKQFDIKTLAASTKKTYTLEVPAFGTIKYQLLTSTEAKNLNLDKITDNAERMYIVAYGMLSKADPSLQKEDFDNLPFDAKVVLTEALARIMPSFLATPQ
jgi:hypothetical protein